MYDEIGHGFVKAAIDTGERCGTYYSLNNEYEAVYRLFSYDRDKRKSYHKKWLLEHSGDIKQELVDRYYPCDIRKLLG